MASALADPAGGSSGARSAPLLQGRGLLRLPARPPARDSHTQTRARAHARTGAGVQCQRRSELTNPPRRRPSPRTHHSGLGAGDHGPEESAGPTPEVTPWRPRFAEEGLHPSTLAAWRQRSPSHPLAVPSPHLGTLRQRSCPRLGLARGSSIAAPEARPLHPPQAGGKETLGGWEETRSWGTDTSRGRVSFPGATLQPRDPRRVLLVSERKWCLARIFPLDTHAHARGAGQGCGCAPLKHTSPALAPRSHPRRRNKGPQRNLSTLLRNCYPGAWPGGQSAGPQSRDGSPPLCGWSALLHTSAPQTPVKRLRILTYVCVGDGGRVCVCEGGAYKKLGKLNVL